MIRIRDLSKQADGTRILRGVSFSVAPQTVLGIIGASGSGKTTLLRCLNGLERINAGVIECDEVRLEASLASGEYARKVKELRRKVGTVFQHLYLFPHLTVLDNIVEAPVHVLREPRAQAESSSASRLPGPWRCVPNTCSLTNQPARLIRNELRACARYCSVLFSADTQ